MRTLLSHPSDLQPLNVFDRFFFFFWSRPNLCFVSCGSFTRYNTKRFWPGKIDAFYFLPPTRRCRRRRHCRRTHAKLSPARWCMERRDHGQERRWRLAYTNGHSQTHTFAFFKKGVPPGMECGEVNVKRGQCMWCRWRVG